MRRDHSPTVRLRRLAAELRRAREQASLGLMEAARELGWSAPKLSKFENAERKINTADLDKVLDLYDVTDGESREDLHQLLRDAKERGWWSAAPYRGVFTDSLPDFEAEASVIRTYECQVIPGLLQLPEYAESVFRGGQVRDDAAIRRSVEARVQRQSILNRFDPPRYWAIIDEAALRRSTRDPKVMRNQLKHLVHMAARHNITLNVLPFSAGHHAALNGSFVLLDFPHPLDPALGYSETYAASMFVEQPDEIERYEVAFGLVQNAALGADESVALFEHLIAESEDPDA
ncbi:helix-turn-helix domain-containing protein [Nocardiopsis sp. CNT-189]|uniref:helix-turn-helix domain-containing protein n=1 Tax=Nocardiopsis oceanisediminis TaxID=2816862 RepID=UPI003B2D631B